MAGRSAVADVGCTDDVALPSLGLTMIIRVCFPPSSYRHENHMPQGAHWSEGRTDIQSKLDPAIGLDPTVLS